MNEPELKLSVGELRGHLADLADGMEITFGSSKTRNRPLVFFRVKQRGKNRLQIELNELDNGEVAEIDDRITVGKLLRQLHGYGDEMLITFGSSIDAVPFEFRNIDQVVAINLEQTQEPQYHAIADEDTVI